MISGLHGHLEALGPDWASVNVSGVTYKVSCPTSTLASIGSVGDRVRLHTYLLVRQDSLTLYGFATPQEEQLFEMLLTVSGIGPRHALSLLSTASVEHLASAIVSGDEALLAAVPGIGKKTASRLVLELKGKLEKEWGAMPGPTTSVDGDALAALQALGYSLSEARSALASLPANRKLPLEEKVRLALQRLARG
jgi:Holliday junction DNA helicase RuvA